MKILWDYPSWYPLRDKLWGGGGGGGFLCWCGFVYLQDLCGQEIFFKLINVVIVKFVPHKLPYVRYLNKLLDLIVIS